VASQYTVRVHALMDHVRAHLDQDLNLDALAKRAGFSPFHFHRVFKATTGETLAQFTRRARLERAAYLMKGAPSRSLASIAVESGFASHSDLSRAFTRVYGLAPSRWDRKRRLDAVPEDRPEPRAPPDPPFSAQLRSHGACRLAYVRMQTWFVGDALPRGFAKLTAWLQARDVDWRSTTLHGLSWDNYATTPLEKVRFDFGFPVPPHVHAEGEIGIHELPAVRAVDVHCRGSLQRIADAWDYLYDDWLPNSGYQPADLPGIKRFRTGPDVLGWNEWDLDCSIAVRPLTP